MRYSKGFPLRVVLLMGLLVALPACWPSQPMVPQDDDVDETTPDGGTSDPHALVHGITFLLHG